MIRFKRPLYFIHKIVFDGHDHRYIESDDGTLFAGKYRTKIYESDLPEWYLYGRYYKRWGYLSTKGIVDMLYIPNMHINHFLKDDCLLVSYDKQIRKNTDCRACIFEKYKGWDERIYGSEIIGVLKGARKYSNYDISSIIEQIKEKQIVFKERHPRDYEYECKNFDVDACFRDAFDNGRPPKYYALTLNDYFSPSFVSGSKQYYGTLDDIRTFIKSLDSVKFQDTIAAFQSFIGGNKDATHCVAYAQRKMLTPVKLIKRSFHYNEGPAQWDFQNIWGFNYTMMYDNAYAATALIQDGDKYIRCIKPTIYGLVYNDDIISSKWHPVTCFWGHPNVLSYKDDSPKRSLIEGNLFFPERTYDDIKLAVSEFESKPLDLSIICEEIFADG